MALLLNVPLFENFHSIRTHRLISFTIFWRMIDRIGGICASKSVIYSIVIDAAQIGGQ